MKKMKWILISLGGVLALGSGGGWLALRSWVQANATPDAVVRQVEAEWNCRADLKTIDVSLFSTPARVVATNFSIAQRDGEVGKPLAQRTPEANGPSLLLVRDAQLELDTQDLMAQRLHVRKLALSDVWAREEVTPEGISLMQEAFRKPTPTPGAAPLPIAPPLEPLETPGKTVDVVPPPASEPPAAPPVATAAPETKPSAKAQKPHESSLPFGLVVDEATIEKGTFRIRNRQARTTTNLNDLNLRITGVDVDTGNLAQHNACKIELAGRVDSSGRTKVGEETKDIKFADFELVAHGQMKPYDEATRLFAPHGRMTLQLKKGSVFGGTQTIGQAAAKEKSFSKLKDYGIDVSDLVIGGALQEEVTVDVNYEQGKVQFETDVRFSFPEYAITLRKGSWINGAADDHDMHLQLLPTDAVAKKIMDGVKEKMGDGMAKLALSLFNDGHGKLAFDIVSSERLSKPKFRLDGAAGAVEQLIRGLIKQ